MLMQTFSFASVFLFLLLYSLNKLLSGNSHCAQPQNSLSSRLVIDYFIYMLVCMCFSKVGTSSPTYIISFINALKLFRGVLIMILHADLAKSVTFNYA